MEQIVKAKVLGAYTRWFNDWALLVGWAIGIAFARAWRPQST